MDTRLAVFIVHGIGDQKKGFRHDMQENLRSSFKKALQHMGQGDREGQEDTLIFREGLWADITQEGQDTLKNRMFNHPDTDMSIGLKHENSLWIISVTPSPISKDRLQTFTHSTMLSKAELMV